MKELIFKAFKEASMQNKRDHEEYTKRVIGDKADIVTKGDLEIGDLITNILLKKENVVVESEEHGKQTNLTSDNKEDFYIAIDDIDGTNNLRVGNNFLPYCSMIVVFEDKTKKQEEYKYSDYTHAACLDYINDRIFYTEKGLGKVAEYDINGKKLSESIKNSIDKTGLALSLSTDIVSSKRGGKIGYASQEKFSFSILPSELDTVYKKYAMIDSGCSVFEYAMVGMGIRDGYVSSGKKQHELPLLYAFSKETGKNMMDFEGNLYDDKIYDFSGRKCRSNSS